MFFLLLLPISFSTFAFSPVITEGEVKITYPCSILEQLSKSKESKEEITFYEKGQTTFFDQNFILRKRSGERRNDLTFKFRENGKVPSINEDLYLKLMRSKEGQLKCEADVVYRPTDPSFSYACSFKSSATALIKEHNQFLKMSGLTKLELANDLSGLREVKIKATSWKYLPPVDRKPVHLRGAASIERWLIKDQCFLEISAGFESAPESLRVKALQALDELKNLIPFSPAVDQGNKTGRVLGL